MASSRNDIPQVILIPRMKTTNKSVQEGDDVNDAASNSNSTNHVSVASLGSKQTDSTNKSVVAVDSPQHLPLDLNQNDKELKVHSIHLVQVRPVSVQQRVHHQQ